MLTLIKYSDIEHLLPKNLVEDIQNGKLQLATKSGDYPDKVEGANYISLSLQKLLQGHDAKQVHGVMERYVAGVTRGVTKQKEVRYGNNNVRIENVTEQVPSADPTVLKYIELTRNAKNINDYLAAIPEAGLHNVVGSYTGEVWNRYSPEMLRNLKESATTLNRSTKR